MAELALLVLKRTSFFTNSGAENLKSSSPPAGEKKPNTNEQPVLRRESERAINKNIWVYKELIMKFDMKLC